MSATEATHDGGSDAPTINGHALDSVDGVRKAMSYLKKDYNNGDLYDISTLDGSDAIAIESRTPHFQHMSALMDARCGGYIRIASIRAQNDHTLRIEVTEP